MKIVELKFEYSDDIETQNYWTLNVDDGRKFILYEDEFLALIEEILLWLKDLHQKTLEREEKDYGENDEDVIFQKKLVEAVDLLLEN